MSPLQYWLITAIEQAYISGGFQITIDTDVACHCWLRYTDIKPQIHFEPKRRRGIQIYTDYRFCFVAYHDLEQDEAGDTYHHTFTWTGWEVCNFKYFYFWATSWGEPMISTTCTFYKHYTPAGEEQLLYSFDKGTTLASLLFSNIHYGRAFALPINATLTKISVRLSKWSAYGDIPCQYVRMDLRLAPFENATLPDLIETVERVLPSYPDYPYFVWTPFTFAHQPLIANTKYSIFLVGCTPAFDNPRYRVDSQPWLDIPENHRSWVWFGHLTPPELNETIGATRSIKIYGIPT